MLAALKRLKRRKAAGIDGLRAEFLTDAAAELAAPLSSTFTSIFLGSFPHPLNCQIVHPIFKNKGDPLDPNNYRCLSVGPVLSKLYAMILDSRITQWAEGHQVRSPFQAGFRPGHRTVDHIFTLKTLIDQARFHKRRLYCCFVDFKKAFDSVPRHLLWQRLAEAGIHGHMLSALQSLYDRVTARVQCPAGLTDPFPCDIGVKQGCPLSPLLFGLYIDRIAPLLSAADPTAPALAGLAVACLLYADDLALLSTTPEGLQRQLDALHSFCLSSHLDVNLTKTDIVVFNSPASAARPHTWTFGTAPVKISPSYCYLGITFHCHSGICRAPADLLAAGRRALFSLYRRCADLRLDTPSLMCKLFDALISPILSYGCEAWAHAPKSATALKPFEVFHRSFLKRISGMHHTTPDTAVYGEFGRTPLSIRWLRHAANFYGRLACMPAGSLAKHAFSEALNLEQCGYTTGLGSLRRQLAACGLPALTLPGLASLTPVAVREATADHWAATWRAQLIDHPHAPSDGRTSPHRHTSQRAHYASIHPTFTPTCQPYLTNPSIPRQHRATTARFRCGNHWLAVHTSRYLKAAERKRHHDAPCTHCGHHTWDEPDFMLICDHCDTCRHGQCLQPPLPEPPPPLEDWFCPDCTSRGLRTPLARQAAEARASLSVQCPHCQAATDDPHHFLFTCPFYSQLRDRYSGLFQDIDSVQTFLAQPTSSRVSAYLSHCFKLHTNSFNTVP